MPIQPNQIKVSRHAAERAKQRGTSLAALINVVLDPSLVYESKKFPGQMRYVKGDYCVAFDPKTMVIITVFYNGRLDPKWDGGAK